MDKIEARTMDGAGVGDGPFSWRVAEGVIYAEMPLRAGVRPPLLSEWEMQRVAAFRNPRRRNMWLAGRSLAKVLIRERLRVRGIVDIRDGVGGEHLLMDRGLPRTDVWLDISHRHNRVCALIADRPVALDVRRVSPADAAVTAKVVTQRDRAAAQRIVRDEAAADCIAWAVKEAAIASLRLDPGTTPSLRSVELRDDFDVQVGDTRLHVFAVRVIDDLVITVVGRPLLHETAVTKVLVSGQYAASLNREPAKAPEATPSRFVEAVERSLTRARRVADARARWSRLRWST